MKFGGGKFATVLVPVAFLALVTCAPAVVSGQEAASEPAAKVEKEKPANDATKLSDATRVSTEEAARKAANQKAKGDGSTPAESKEKSGASNKGDTSSTKVIELQPSDKAKDKSADESNPADRSQSKHSKIHGSVTGAAGAGGRAGDAEIGAGSKSGKTHIYVETGRTETPQPH